MIQELISFSRLLREAGLVIAASEISDAHQGLALMGNPCAGATHYRILRSTLVKRTEDLGVFDSLYQLFFGGDAAVSSTQEAREHATGQGLKAAGLPTLAAAMLSGEPCHSRVRDAVIKLRGNAFEDA